MGGGSSTDFPLRPGQPLSGLFAHFTKEYRSNPQAAGLLEVSGTAKSSRCFGRIEDILVPRQGGEWTSANEAGAFVLLAFTRVTVRLSAYAIKTFSGRAGTAHLRSWRLEGSPDGYDWAELDCVDGSDALNAPDAVVARTVRKADFFSQFRLTQTAANHFGSNCLTIQQIEFFGEFRYNVTA
jgi:hypothetical protein